MMYDIFISYRRQTRAEELALLLYRRFTSDGYSVSHDHSTFNESKLPFDETIDIRINQCEDFLCIISTDTFDRCAEEEYNPSQDWMLHEIRFAIKNKKHVIPIRLDIDTFPSNLPESIKGLERYNAPKYSAEYFDAFYQKLKDSLKTKAVQSRNADALYDHAIYQLENNNKAKGVEQLFEAANKGSAAACCKLGELYLRSHIGESWNVKYNPEVGISWINKAFNKGYPPAYYELGLLHLKGTVIKKDTALAIKLFEKGAELGDSNCINELGLCHLNGIVFKQDFAEAASLFKIAAEMNSSKGCMNYAMCCRDGKGVEQDSIEYFRYMKTASLLGLPEAHFQLALAYMKGEGNPGNPKKAFESMSSAYKCGRISDAAYYLAEFYELGIGTDINIEKAAELYKESILLAKDMKRFDIEYSASKKLSALTSKHK